MQKPLDSPYHWLYQSAVVAIGLALLFAAAAFAADKESSDEEKPILDPAAWKITYPVASEEGDALEVKNPAFTARMADPETRPKELRKYFYASEEGLVFHTAYTGVTTSSNTKYSRTELRGMDGAKENNWTLEAGGQLHCRLKITDLEGGANKLIFMQIHGKAPNPKPLLKCTWEKGRIRLATKKGENLNNFKRKQHYAEIPKNEWFTCTINAGRDAVVVRINGEIVETYSAEEVLNDWPSDNTYYFKAGNYLQHDTDGATSTVVFSEIDVSHP